MNANIVEIIIVILLIITVLVAGIILKISEAFFLVCGVAVAATIGVVAVVIIRRRFNSRRKQLESDFVSESRDLRIEYSFLRRVAGVPTKFNYEELKEATNNFGSLLGHGSSASVFKGILKDGTQVAVKRIEGGGDPVRSEKEFQSEVAAISSVQHVNLVRLIGFCSIQSPGKRLLVYEFIYNGSLDNWIFPKSGKTRSAAGRGGGCLPWESRCRVALDVAKALSYLHHDCRSCILHLDVKPENILLNERHQAIVTDFGFSKLKGKEESRVVTTVRGTRGYLAPEWVLENGITEKCDVYSYGMLLLEIIGGQRNVSVVEDENDKPKKKIQCFAKIVVEKLREEKVMEIVDRRLVAEKGGGVEEWLVRRLVCIALWCIQEKPKRRPSMATVVEMLESRVAVEEPPATEIFIVDLLAVGDGKWNPGYLENKDATSSSSIVGGSFGTSELSGR